jgi:hypothetical protein
MPPQGAVHPSAYFGVACPILQALLMYLAVSTGANPIQLGLGLCSATTAMLGAQIMAPSCVPVAHSLFHLILVLLYQYLNTQSYNITIVFLVVYVWIMELCFLIQGLFCSVSCTASDDGARAASNSIDSLSCVQDLAHSVLLVEL